MKEFNKKNIIIISFLIVIIFIQFIVIYKNNNYYRVLKAKEQDFILENKNLKLENEDLILENKILELENEEIKSESLNEENYDDTYYIKAILTYKDIPELNELILDNPIDKYNEPIYEGWRTQYIEELNEYRILWEQEIAYTIEKLEKHLNSDDYKKLIEAQEKWKQYLDSEIVFEQSVYYREELQILEINRYRALNTRQRAINLMTYLYEFEDDIDFYYNKKNKPK